MKGKLVKHAARVALGIGVALALLEGVFHVRDHGAFPHLNIYQADAKFGVRLRPSASTRIAFGGSDVTLAATHSQGFRSGEPGAEPPPRANEALFVGDSQVFGLGVEANQTFAARFGELAKRPVYNAGVPTWGPPEFAASIDELGKRRKPSTVVYVVNFANDAFEAKRSNRERHVAWDGWAVRRELAPAHVSQFPGRELLFRQSHLVFAWRKWWHGFGEQKIDERGTPSEGTFRDLIDLGRSEGKQRDADRLETARRGALYETEMTYADEAYRNAEARVRALVWEQLKLGPREYENPSTAAGSVYLAADANPGDIVTPGYGEEGRPVFATAEYIRKGVELRNQFEATLRERAEKVLSGEEAKRILSALSARDEERLKRETLRIKPLELVRHASPLVQSVLDAKRRSDALGAQFVLLVLPLDVMVSEAEWPKHSSRKVDLAPAQVLIDDLVEAVRDAGAVAVDATPALRRAEPGAFLPGDIHLTPKGHQAVATVLHDATQPTQKPKFKPHPSAPLPLGRSRVPAPETWQALAGEIAVNNSGRCPITKKFREWLYIACFAKSEREPTGVGIRVDEGGHGDEIISLVDGRMTLVVPMPRGEKLRALFTWSDGMSKRLLVDWDAQGVAPDLRMEVVKDEQVPPAPHSELMKALCDCHKAERKVADCNTLVAHPDADCARTYAGQCASLLACSEGDALFAPECASGFVNQGATSRCVAGEGKPSGDRAPLAALKPVDESALKSSGRALVVSAQAFVGDGCKLDRDEVELISVIPFDRCPIDDAMVKSYRDALTAFRAVATPEQLNGAAKTFAEHAGWFNEWVGLALASRNTRGTAALYQQLALAFNAWQSDKPVFVDSPRMVKLYFGVSGVRTTDYFRNLKGDGPKREAEFLASGRHFVWRRGPNGFEGPFESIEERVVGGY